MGRPSFFQYLKGALFLRVCGQNGRNGGYSRKILRAKKEEPLRIAGYLNLICAAVLENSEFGEAQHIDGILYQKVISYLSKHYAENLVLSEVAKEFGYNTKYLSHALHSLTGINFRRLLNVYRVNHAKALLKNDKNKSIAYVAEESGFGALNTFNREFKNLVGLTPREYRDLST